MQEIVQLQREFFNSNISRDISFRKEQLRNLLSLLKSNEAELCEAIHTDFGKSEFETIATELEVVYKDIRKTLKHLHRWAEERRIPTNLLNFPGRSYLRSEPLGVSLIIGAWNYPYQLSLAPAVAAIAAGCTVILKPSELPARTSAIMAKLINTTFDKGFFHVIEGGVEVTTELLKQKFDKIFFTGSTRVGRIVYEAAARQLTPVTLELGGKSPAFVTHDCNLKMTVKRLIWAKFLNAGQTCIAPDYVMVDNGIKQKFLEQCVREIIKRNYSLDDQNYVQIINDANLERLSVLIDKEKVFFGGEIDVDNRSVMPTILTEISFDDAIMKDEIFGPLLPVIGYDDLDKAIQQVRSLPRPLSCYVFSKNEESREKILNEVSFGGGGVNEAVMHITNMDLPFGGVGPSGIGKYHGEAGFREFSNIKGVLSKPTWFELNLKYSPLSKTKLSWIRRFFKF